MRLLDQLRSKGCISAEQSRIVLSQQEHLRAQGSRARVGELLLENQFVQLRELAEALAEQGTGVAHDIRSLLPYSVCDRFRILPTRHVDRTLHVQACDILTEAQQAAILIEAERHLGERPDALEIVAAPKDHIAAGLRVFDHSGSVEASLRDIEADPDNGAHLNGLIDTILAEAVRRGASDIHLDWYELSPQYCFVSYRVDGDLTRQHLFSPRTMIAVLRRLKSRCGMDASEARRSQSGRFDFLFNGRRIDIRAESNAMDGGAFIVMRLLDPESLRTLDGLFPAHPEVMRGLSAATHMVAKQPGIIIVTGATGQGKTTTLYALIRAMALYRMNVMTVEDPVEFRLSFARQVWFNAYVHKSFSDVLPSLLRSDPDAIVVGEFRDAETAIAGLRYAETGHMVMTTLHAPNAFATYDRLLNMLPQAGRREYIASLIGSATAFLNQQLLPRLCADCAQPLGVGDHRYQMVARTFGEHVAAGAKTRGKCAICSGRGSIGRVGLPEALFFTGNIDARIDLVSRLVDGATLAAVIKGSDGAQYGSYFGRLQALEALMVGGYVAAEDALALVAPGTFA